MSKAIHGKKFLCRNTKEMFNLVYISFANLFFTVCVFNVDDNSIIKLITIL